MTKWWNFNVKLSFHHSLASLKHRVVNWCQKYTVVIEEMAKYTAPIKYLNTYKWSHISEPEIVCQKLINEFDAQLSSAHFDTSFVALRCCLADLWVLEWLKVEFQKLQKLLFKQERFIFRISAVRVHKINLKAESTFKQ